MFKVKWLVAAGLMASATGCVDPNGYSTTGYGGYPSYGSGYPSYGSGYPSYGYGGYPSYGYGSYPSYGSGYGYNSGYYSQPTTVYQPTRVVTQTQTRYVPVPVPSTQTSTTTEQHHHNRHGDWDKNGDGIPDRYQQR